jgi:hypothetical protein
MKPAPGLARDMKKGSKGARKAGAPNNAAANTYNLIVFL